MVTCFSYKIKKGDTLQRLAVKYNLSSWKELVYINDLKYPFIIDEIVDVTEKQQNLVYIGDTILIPASSVASLNYVSKRELEKRIYGCDIKLGFETHLNNIERLDSQRELNADALGDIEQVNGRENVKQSLLNRLTTRLGDIPMHPDFGSRFLDMLGRKNTKTNLIDMRLEAMETFKKDSRVSDVVNCKLTSKDIGVLVECDIYLKSKDSFKFSEIL